jgi:hypothetical protein
MSRTENVSGVHSIDFTNGLVPDTSFENKGLPLHEIFKDDTQSSSNPAKTELSLKSGWLSTWLPLKTKENTSTVEAPTQTVAVEAAKPRPIDSTPMLEKPDLIDESLSVAPFSKTGDTAVKGSEKKYMEAIALMSSLSMEQVMTIVMKEQLEIEKDRLVTTQDGLLKLQDLKKLHQQTVDNVRDHLLKDEKVYNFFGSAASVAKFASFLCSFVALAVSLAGAAGIAAPAALTYAMTVGTYSTSGFTAIVKGGQYYSETRVNQDKAALIESNHKRKSSNEQIDSHSEKVLSISEANTQFEEHLISLLKMRERMGKVILNK